MNHQLLWHKSPISRIVRKAIGKDILINTASRILLLKITIVFGFTAGLLLSYQLWVSARSYPLVPIFPLMLDIAFPFDYILFFILLVLLAIIAFSKKPTWPIFTFTTLIGILGILDQSRWQPWVYQYVFMLFAFGFLYWKKSDALANKKIINTSRLIIVSIYFWSGLQKINTIFVFHTFPWMIEPILQLLPEYTHGFLLFFGILVPFIETGIGIGLLTKRYRNAALIGAIAIHLFILNVIGPLGHNWNGVVWPWNIAMICFVALLFWNEKQCTLHDILWIRNAAFQKIVFVLFAFMPAFSFFNLWDAYLSAALYSGNTSTAVIRMSDDLKQKLPVPIQRYIHADRDSPGANILSILDWSLGELNVPPYPETRIYKHIFRTLCNYATNPSEMTLIIKEKSSFFGEGYEKTYNCVHL